ncbi:MAG: nitrous oxide-stimulated promoter family protein [Kiritimatiellaeota bacterium]|nr:nitrous oxide-stimulated promoter family protein [Kiritimatiellota bacterium]
MKRNTTSFRLEEKTLRAMIAIYCRHQHRPAGALCPDCAALEQYALQRLERCPYGAQKPTCAVCTVHCYEPALRARTRRVMRFAGPLLLKRHPLLALRHLARRLRRPPVRPRRAVA